MRLLLHSPISSVDERTVLTYISYYNTFAEAQKVHLIPEHILEVLEI